MVQLVAPRQSQTELKLQQEGSYSLIEVKIMSFVSVQGIELYLAL